MRNIAEGEKIMVTVVIYTNNAEKNLKKCVYSILNQTYEDFEILIIDDASADRTSEIALSLEEEDERIRFIGTLKKGGVASAKNTGIYQASGNYIMFLNSDDELEPNALKRMTYVAKQSKADLVIGNFKCIYENDKKEKKNNAIFTSGAMYNHVFRDEDVIDCVHFQCIEGNKLWNTEMISHCGVRFQNTCISSDFIFYHQCLGYCKVVATISDKILLRHIYSNSNSKKYSDVITSKTPFEMILDGYKKAGRESFAAEIQKDELIYILDELKKIPEYDTKEIRKKVFESLTEIDFDSSLFSTEEEKKMITQYKKIKAGKWWYVSDIRAAIRR